MDSKGIVEKADSKKIDSKGVVEKADFRGHSSRLIRLVVGVIVGCAVVAAICLIIIRVTGINDSNTTHQYIEEMYVPSLDAAAASILNKTTTTFNTSVYVDLKFERSAALTRLDYPNDFQMALFYGQYSSSNSLVDSHIVKGFSMERKTRVHRVKVVVEAAMMPWQQWIQATLSGNVVPIVVELKGVYKNKQIGELDGPELVVVVVVADVLVDASGHMVSKDLIKFTKPLLSIASTGINGRRRYYGGDGVLHATARP